MRDICCNTLLALSAQVLIKTVEHPDLVFCSTSLTSRFRLRIMCVSCVCECWPMSVRHPECGQPDHCKHHRPRDPCRLTLLASGKSLLSGAAGTSGTCAAVAAAAIAGITQVPRIFQAKHSTYRWQRAGQKLEAQTAMQSQSTMNTMEPPQAPACPTCFRSHLPPESHFHSSSPADSVPSSPADSAPSDFASINDVSSCIPVRIRGRVFVFDSSVLPLSYHLRWSLQQTTYLDWWEETCCASHEMFSALVPHLVSSSAQETQYTQKLFSLIAISDVIFGVEIGLQSFRLYNFGTHVFSLGVLGLAGSRPSKESTCTSPPEGCAAVCHGLEHVG